MFVCPYDSHWCSQATCRSGFCEMTREPPFIVCIDCGAAMHDSPGLRLCVDCMFVTKASKEGDR